MANQFRNYLLTVNNPVQTDEEFFDYLKTLRHIKYFVFQREQGNETGTQHFQLYIEFEVGKTFATMKEYFPTAHIESRKAVKRKPAIIAVKPIPEWTDTRYSSTASLWRTANAPTSTTLRR